MTTSDIILAGAFAGTVIGLAILTVQVMGLIRLGKELLDFTAEVVEFNGRLIAQLHEGAPDAPSPAAVAAGDDR